METRGRRLRGRDRRRLLFEQLDERILLTAAPGRAPRDAAVADFDGDGVLDAATVNSESDDVAILRGRGDGTFEFPAFIELASDSAPSRVIATDLNGDDRLDLVTANSGSGSLSVLLGEPDGGFRFLADVNLDVSSSSLDIVAVDLDRDGDPDLATTSAATDEVILLSGLGSGLLEVSSRIALPADSAPTRIVAADVDGDSMLDLATVNNGSGEVAILVNDGGGGIAEVRRHATGLGPGLAGLVAEDLNGDGNLDLSTVADGGLVILAGLGGGLFAEPLTVAADLGAPTDLASGDLDEDGRSDLVAVYAGKSYLAVFPSLAGAFPARFWLTQKAASEDQGGLTLSDIDGDDQLDVILVNAQTHDLSVLLGPDESSASTDYRTNQGDHPQAMASGDVNGDGRLDMIVANADSDDVSILLRAENGIFESPILLPLEGSEYPHDVVAVDLTGDGWIDLATANRDTGDVSVFVGIGHGDFQSPVRIVLNEGSWPTALVAADFTGDGKVDIATANTLGGTVSLLAGRGDGSFATPIHFAADIQDTPSWSNLAAADLNGDEALDLVVGHRFDSHLTVLLNNGSGVFTAGETVILPEDFFRFSMAAGELNGDGQVDLVLVDGFTATALIFPGRGDGTFANLQRFSFTEDRLPDRFALGDLNADGLDDVVLGHRITSQLSVYLATGDYQLDFGTEFEITQFASGVRATDVHLADFDGDGVIDVGYTQFPTSSSVPVPYAGIAVGNGDGTLRFDYEARISAGWRLTDVAQADLNGDGLADVVTVNEKEVTVLLATGLAAFEPPRHFPSRGRSIQVADVTGDAIPDLVVTNEHMVEVLEGNGLGGFTTLHRFVPNHLDSVKDVAVVDVTNDDVPDILALGGNQQIVTFVSNGDGTFRRPLRSATSLRNQVALVVADFDLDGAVDTAIASSQFDVVAVLKGDGTGRFGNEVVHEVAVTNGGWQIVTGDFNGDAALDLGVLDRGGNIAYLWGGAGGSFAAGPSSRVTSHLGRLTPADVDGDGDLDFVTSVSGGAAVIIREDDGLHVSRVFSDIRMSPAIPADVDGDGDLDIVGGQSHPDNTITIATNNGVGEFESLVSVPSGSGLPPYRIAVADVSGDGNADVVALSGTPDVVISRGLGDGTFAQPIYVPFGQSLVDLNDDGVDDRIVIDPESEQIRFALGRPEGGFAGELSLPTPTGSVALGDLNGDGYPDMVEAQEFRNFLQVTLGVGDGTFRPRIEAPTRGAYPTTFGVFDVNNDGLEDLVTANRSSLDVAIRLGNGGGFDSPVYVPAIRDPESFVVGDFDTDGFLDLVLTGHGDIQLLRGTGDHRLFSEGVEICCDGISLPPSRLVLATADINGDGHLDLAASDAFRLRVILLNGNGNGSFSVPTIHPTQGSRFYAVPIALGDFDGDGNVDIVTTDPPRHRAGVLFADGNGGFLAPLWVPARTNSLVVADFNDDGLDDFATADLGNAGVYLARDDRTFEPRWLELVERMSHRGVDAGDVDQDGNLDLVVAFREHVEVIYGDGNGQFSLPSVIGTPSPPHTSLDMRRLVVVKDVDADYRTDIAFVIPELDTVRVIGSPSFEPRRSSIAPPSVTLSVDQSSIPESGGRTAVFASLESPSTHDVRVDFGIDSTSDPQEFAVSATSLIIPAGQVRRAITVESFSELIDDGDTTVTIEVIDVENAVEVNPQSVVVTIIDDDDETIVLGPAPDNAGIVGPDALGFRFSFQGPLNVPAMSNDFFVHASQQGQLADNTETVSNIRHFADYAYGGALFPGERVQATLRAGLATFFGPVPRRVWELRGSVPFGSGTFATGGQSLGGGRSADVKLGDLDGDGDLDAFVANKRQGNKIWLNQEGTFADSGQQLGSGASYAIELADLDGDGDLDAFVVNGRLSPQSNRIWWNQSGIFTDSGQEMGSSFGAALGDLDGDGDQDAFVTRFGDGGRIWLNDGGVLRDSGQSLGTNNSVDVALGDFDSDGDLDAFVVNVNQPDRVWWNDAGVFVDSGQTLGMSTGRRVDLGDLDGDGDLDALVVNGNQPAQPWLNEAGEFVAGEPSTTGDTRALSLGDLDGDGDVDAFVAVARGPERVWFNEGGQIIDSGQLFGGNLDNDAAVDLGDLDGDGDLDAFVVNESGANAIWLNTTPIITLSANTDNLAEANGMAVLTATISEPINQPVVATIEFTGEAEYDVDYVVPNQIVIPPGQTSASVTMVAVQDSLDEPQESVAISLTDVLRARASGDPIALAIDDDDEPVVPEVLLNSSTALIAENKGVAAFELTLSEPTTVPVTVDVSASGSATAFEDYTLSATRVIIPPGSVTSALVLTAVQDAVDEPDEQVVLDIAAVENGIELGIQQRVVTIVDDDAPLLAVEEVVPDASGFVVRFTAPFDLVTLNQLRNQATNLRTSDIELTGAATGAVRGSLLADPSQNSLRFLKTGLTLAADTYTLTIRGGAGGLRGTAGQLLEEDYVSQFVVEAPPEGSIIVGLPDFLRGPGQGVDLPTSAVGLPLSVSRLSGVRSLDATLLFDPDLLEIDTIVLSEGLPAGATVAQESLGPGQLRVSLRLPADVAEGTTEFARLMARVPADATLGEQQAILLRDVSVQDALSNPIPTVPDHALHLAVYPGDVTGNRRINASDAAQVARFTALLDDGFAFTPLTDPGLVGDVSGNGRVNAVDSALIARFAALLPVPEIPAIPRPTAARAQPPFLPPRNFDGPRYVEDSDDYLTVGPSALADAATPAAQTTTVAAVASAELQPRCDSRCPSSPARASKTDLAEAIDQLFSSWW